MELALNLVWLILSAGLIVACQRQKIGADRRALAVIALICLIAFLFPVISITDDLNAGTLFAEANKQTRSLFSGDLAALIVAAFLALQLTMQRGPSVLLSNKRPRALKSYVVQLNRRPPPVLA